MDATDRISPLNEGYGLIFVKMKQGVGMIEGIDEATVTAWIRSKIPDLADPVEYDLITGGHSNLTYRCRDATGAMLCAAPAAFRACP